MGKQISERMLSVLKLAEAGEPLDTGVFGRSGFGGLSGTVSALRRRGMLDGDEITDLGKAVLARVAPE